MFSEELFKGIDEKKQSGSDGQFEASKELEDMHTFESFDMLKLKYT